MSPFFITLLIWSALFIVGALIRPKPDIENAKPKGLGDFNFPTATEGRAVPLIWGRVKLKAPNVTWYGGLRAEPITVSVKTGIFSSEDQITGFRYFLGMQLSLCKGPITQMVSLHINEKTAFWGTQTSSGAKSINAPNVFGGEDTGHGGVVGSGHLYFGSKTEAANAYLTTQTGAAIGYRGVCNYVFQGGYMGTSSSVPPWVFVVDRMINGLGLAFPAVNIRDCNPMNVVYEIMTDTDWGLGISVSLFDLTNFRDAADVLRLEGNGFSMVLDNERPASELISEVMRQIDGSLYFDRAAGLWRIILARDDYVPATISLYDESNVIELTDYSRTTWEETTNQVRVKFVDRGDGFKDTYAMAQDMANVIIQGSNVSVELNFPGVMDRTLANKLAWRELKTLAYPLAKINITINRDGFDLVPGNVFRFSWGRLGISEVVFRVARIEYGTITDNTIAVYAVQDIFAAGSGVFADPPGTGWTQPVDEAVAPLVADTLYFEAPGQMVMADPANSQLNPRVWAGARFPGGGTINFRMYSKFGATPSPPGDFVKDSAINKFLLAGTVETLIPDYGNSAVRPATDYTIRINDDDPDDLSSLVVSGNVTLVSSLINLIYVDGEFIGFESLADAGGNVYQLINIYRGLFNSAPKEHAVDTDVWFIGQTGGNLTSNIPQTGYDEADLQLRSQDKIGEMDEGDSNTVSLPTLTDTWSEPLPPRDPELNGGYAPTSGSFDTDYSTETGFSGDDGLGCSVEVTPRAWRIPSIVQDHLLSGSPVDYLDDNPEFDFLITLDPDGTPLDAEVFNVSATETPIAYITRNALIVAAGSNNPIDTAGRLTVTAIHWPSGLSQQSAVKDMIFDFTVSTALQSADDVVFGGLTINTASDAVVFGENGSYAINIHKAFSTGIVEANINGGGWNTIIAATLTTGNIVTTSTSDSVLLRFTQYPADDQYFDITGPTAELGYGVFKAL
jgi:Putative phage tail protein